MIVSVLIVTLNSGEQLLKTINSILIQKNIDFEIVIKDGLSSDGSLEQIPKDDRIHIIRKKDSGIYDAMNQAIEYATGNIAVFMNTGDLFYDDNVLYNVTNNIGEDFDFNSIYYGDCYTANRNTFLRYPSKFDDYVCFTKTLCHQATFYPVSMLKKRNFSLDYKIAADYEYYVYAYINGTKLIHVPVVVVSYQGNGASETKKNRTVGLKESVTIRKANFPKNRYRKTWLKTQLHGAGIKHFLVTQEWFYPFYKKIAELYYRKNQ